MILQLKDKVLQIGSQNYKPLLSFGRVLEKSELITSVPFCVDADDSQYLYELVITFELRVNQSICVLYHEEEPAVNDQEFRDFELFAWEFHVGNEDKKEKDVV